MINYYRDMWAQRSHALALLTVSTTKSTKWEWTEEHAKEFNKVKRTLCKETSLVYLNFNETFEIHTNASDRQIGVVILQDNKPIAFCSRKLSNTQTCHTKTKRERKKLTHTIPKYDE